jgi:RND family efflux transporter MFP subunit
MVAENRINSAKANLDKAEADFKRNERLLKRGAISESAFDIVKTQYIIAQSDYKSTQDQLSLIDEGGRQEDISSANSLVDVARAQLRDAKSNAAMNKVKDKDILAAKAGVQQAQAALDTAKRGLQYTYVKSPISGIVSTRTSDPGQVVSPGQTLASIVDLGSLYLKAEVSEKYLSTVRNGQAVSVHVDAITDKVFQGRVTEIYPSGSTLNRNFFARISIAGADTNLKPGMSASGEILTGTARKVLLVSKDAIDERKGIKSVFTVASGKTAKRHQITVVREDRDFSQLGTPTDLKIGDVVVTEGHNNLQDGTVIEIMKKGSTSNGVN